MGYGIVTSNERIRRNGAICRLLDRRNGVRHGDVLHDLNGDV